MRPILIYHITECESFFAQRRGVPAFGLSYAPAGWEREGFVHCAKWGQLQRVARTFFGDQTGLMVLEIDTTRLDADLRYERASDVPDDYPHVYGSIPGAAVVGFLGVTWSAPGVPWFERLVEGSAEPVRLDAACEIAMRRAESSDLPGVVSMNHQLREDEGYADELSITDLDRRLAEWLDTGYEVWLFTAAYGEGSAAREVSKAGVPATVGYAIVDPGRLPCYIRQLFVMRGARRLGFGRRAVDLLMAHYGVESFDVDALVTNDAAVRFWHTAGFRDRVISMRRNHSASGPAHSRSAAGVAATNVTPGASLAVITGDTRRAVAFVVEGLQRYNDRQSPYHRSVREPGGAVGLAVMLCGSDGEWVGGAVGSVRWGWLSVDYVWVTAAYRKHGFGRTLVLEIERQAVLHGATRAYLTTFDFQARGLYEKLGYRVVGELTDMPPGGANFWMRKDHLER